MSAFLGPIHTWLYGKITFQNDVVNGIIELAKTNGWLDDTIDVDRYGALEEGRLEDIVDETNIHGWLQERVSLVENRLAYFVTALTKADESRIEAVKEAVYTIGRANAICDNIDVKNAYKYLETMLLNGMPCDRVNEVIKEESDLIQWKQVVDIHRAYWDAVGGDIKYYYIIRERLVAGILADTDIEYEEKDDFLFELKKVV